MHDEDSCLSWTLDSDSNSLIWMLKQFCGMGNNVSSNWGWVIVYPQTLRLVQLQDEDSWCWDTQAFSHVSFGWHLKPLTIVLNTIGASTVPYPWKWDERSSLWIYKNSDQKMLAASLFLIHHRTIHVSLSYGEKTGCIDGMPPSGLGWPLWRKF